MPNVYDDQQTTSLEDLERSFAAPSAVESGSDIAAKRRETADLEAAYAAPSATESGSKKLEDAKGIAKKEDSVPTSQDNQINFTGGKNTNKKKGLIRGLFSRKRARNAGIIVGIITTLVGGGSLLGFLNVFSLDTYLSTIENKAFVRYQVDMNGRSSKWIDAYITMRMAEVDDPNVAAGKRDNLLFRSDRVDNNKPLTDWYRTLRASSFEQDVFEKNGIKFTSVASRGANGRIIFRPGVIDVHGEAPHAMGPLTAADTAILESGDINKMNGFLQDFVEVKTFDSDKAARLAIKDAVNNETKPWQWMKRLHIRKDIQNMIGVRDWKFFENTHYKISNTIIDMRNKFLLATLPDNTKTGKFMLCLFGLSDCKLSTDPADPADKQLAPDPSSTKQGGADYVSSDGKTTAPVGDGTAGNITEGALTTTAAGDVAAGATEEVSKSLMKQIIGKLNAASGVVQVVDALSKIDKAIGSKKLSEMVTLARSTQAMGFYTTLATARDQIKTGQLSSGEYDKFMTMVDGIGNNEIWSKVSSPASTNSVAAASLTQTAPSDACSQESLATMTNTSYTPLCSNFKIGGATNASDIENWWNNGLGKVLSPILAAYRNTVGPLVTITNKLTSELLTPLTSAFTAILKATGLQTTINDALGWVVTTVAQQLGAGPMVNSPVGSEIGLISAEGASATAESSMRYEGAAQTTALTQAQTEKSVALYLKDQSSNQSLYDRYASLQNPSSLLSTELFAVAQSGSLKNPANFVASIFGSLTSLPGRLFSPAGATDTTQSGYELAQLSGIETYDFPSQCMNADPLTMTPQTVTNAATLGLIPADELTWDLVNNQDAFYSRLYQSGADTSVLKTVYDCAIFDTSVRGALGAQYGYTDDNSINSSTSAPAASTTIPQGTAIELAQQIISSPNISFQTSQEKTDFQEIVNTGKQTGCGGTDISPRLLGTILALSQKYALVIGVLDNGHACNSGYHPKGMAVDLNGIKPLSGNLPDTGRTIDWSAAEQPTIRQFYTDAIQALSAGGGGELGQIACFAQGTAPLVNPAPGVTIFSDSCDHVHMDVGT